MRVDGALRRFARFRRALSSQLRGGSGPVAQAMRLWERRVLSFLQQRFIRASRGGIWRRHAPSTVRRRGRGAPILIDTERLFRGLRAVHVAGPGIGVGYDGKSGKYPRGPRVSVVAKAHDEGVPPNLPQRKILVPPDDRTRRLMAQDMDRALDELADTNR